MKHENELDIRNVPGVTEDIIREYKKLCRRERYLEEMDRKNRNVSYGYEDEIGFLLPAANTTKEFCREEDAELYKKLADALVKLKAENESWYDAVIAYYYSDEDTSYSTIAKGLGVTKTNVFYKVKYGIEFLRKQLLDE